MLQMFNSQPHIQQLMQAVAKETEHEHNVFLVNLLANASKTQRAHVVQTALTMCNGTYARLLLQLYTKEIGVRNITALRHIAKNF